MFFFILPSQRITAKKKEIERYYPITIAMHLSLSDSSLHAYNSVTQISLLWTKCPIVVQNYKPGMFDRFMLYRNRLKVILRGKYKQAT